MLVILFSYIFTTDHETKMIHDQILDRLAEFKKRLF
jgi:hypothetical protein